MNLQRIIDKCTKDGATPFMVGADCRYFVSDDPETARPAAIRLKSTLTGFKVKDAAVPPAEPLPVLEKKAPPSPTCSTT